MQTCWTTSVCMPCQASITTCTSPTLNAEQERPGASRAQRVAGRGSGAAGQPMSRRGEAKEGSTWLDEFCMRSRLTVNCRRL